MDRIEIACGIDNGYTQYCGVLITSIFETNKDRDVRVHILTDSLSAENQNALLNIAQIYNQTVEIHFIDLKLLAKCPTKEGHHISLAAYYRILIPQMLPKDLHKVIYLDCDIVVNGSLRNLWNTNLEGYSVAAVSDRYDKIDEFCVRLGYDISLGYFNSGVMLINIDYWREYNITKQLLEYISHYDNNFVFHDQDALNYILRDSKILLPIKYNVLLTYSTIDSTILKTECLEALKNPIIIHYTDKLKPWNDGYYMPFLSIYKHFQNLTIWKNCKPIRKVARKELNRIYKIKIALALGLESILPDRYSKILNSLKFTRNHL